MDFFERLGFLDRLEYVDRELTWFTFGERCYCWWAILGPYLETRRAGDITMFNEFASFSKRMLEEDARQRGLPERAVSRDELIRFYESEAGQTER